MRHILFGALVAALVGCGGNSPGSAGDDSAGDDSTGDDGGGGGDAGGDDGGSDGGGDGGGGSDNGTGDNPDPDACDGAKVPGDYASLQNALEAFANAGTDATICLGAGDHTTTDAGFSASGTFAKIGDKTLRIIGVGRNKTFLEKDLALDGPWKSVIVSHLTMASLDVSGGGAPKHVVITASRVEGTSWVLSHALAPVDLTISRTELAGVNMISYDESIDAVLINNVFSKRLDASTYDATVATHPIGLSVVNNTFIGTGAKFDGHTTATVANNIFTGAPYALSWNYIATVTARNNAVWDNTVNYADLAVEGTDYVEADCLLDTSGLMPVLGAGSPCINAGDATVAPETDFANRMRGAQPDIGAVEM